MERIKWIALGFLAGLMVIPAILGSIRSQGGPPAVVAVLRHLMQPSHEPPQGCAIGLWLGPMCYRLWPDEIRASKNENKMLYCQKWDPRYHDDESD